MNTHLAPSAKVDFSASAPLQSADDAGLPKRTTLRGRAMPLVAFFITLFASMAAAATVVATETPALFVGVF